MNKRTTIANYITPLVAINRLLTLEELLRTKVPETKFVMRCFAQDLDNKYDECSVEKLSLKCNTAGCIGGWGTAVAPELSLNCEGELINSRWPRACHDNSSVSFGAAFGLTSREAEKLCLTDFTTKKTPTEAAKHVERLAEKLAKHYGYDIVEA